jgi:aspartate/methionine/tyrosine aminotransferase
VVALNSLSKAYGLPGLRTGWAVGPVDILESMWRRHEYTTISSTLLGNKLAEIVLSPAVHPKVIARTRTLIRAGYPVLQQFIEDHDSLLSLVPPQASAMSFIHYDLDISSIDLVERLRKDQGVLVIPGDHFGVPNHIRLSYALDPAYPRAGFTRIANTMNEIQRGQ